jgi:hypothetical protein
MPPTSAIIRNLAEEIRGSAVGKNWIASFVHHHHTELKSVYLTGIDLKCVKNEYLPTYKLFYDLVE